MKWIGDSDMKKKLWDTIYSFFLKTYGWLKGAKPRHYFSVSNVFWHEKLTCEIWGRSVGLFSRYKEKLLNKIC